MKRKNLVLILTLIILFTFSTVCRASPEDEAIDRASEYIEDLYNIPDFYSEQISAGGSMEDVKFDTCRPLGEETIETLPVNDPSRPYLENTEFWPSIISYGDRWNRAGESDDPERYIGYTKQGLAFTNPEHDFDTAWSAGELYKDKPGRIIEPWTDPDVQNFIADELGVEKEELEGYFQSFPITGGTGNWFYIDNMNRKINQGLMLDRPEVTVNGLPQRQKIVEFMPEEGWLDYTWILQPPTDVSYGYGRMFRKENGVIYYKTVLIPNCLPEYADFSPVPPGESQWLSAYVNEGIKLEEISEGNYVLDFDVINYYGDDTSNIRVYFKDAPWGAENDIAFLEEQFIPGRPLTGEFPDLSICGRKSYSIPFTVPEEKKPGIDYSTVIIKVNDNGLTPETEYFPSNNQLIFRLSTDYNLAAAGISAGVSSPSPNNWYNGTAWFRNDSQSTLNNVPVAVYNNGSVLSLKDEDGNPISTADFAPGQTREFTFSYLFPSSGYSILEAVINTDPLTTIYAEENYDDNKKHTIVSTAVGGGGDGELVFLAHRQKSYLDAMGEPKLYRELNTAKWSDNVRATLDPLKEKAVQTIVTAGSSVNHDTTIAPPPPTGHPCGSYTSLVDWEIIEATLHRPKQDPDFTFNHPVWNKLYYDNWSDDWMEINKDKKKARSYFKELWAMDGAYMYDRIAQERIGPPKAYQLTAYYTVRVTYNNHIFRYVCGDDG